MLPSPQSTAAGNSPRRSKRPRALQACNYCRAKKYRCDGQYPCYHCSRIYVGDLEQRLADAQMEAARVTARYNALATQVGADPMQSAPSAPTAQLPGSQSGTPDAIPPPPPPPPREHPVFDPIRHHSAGPVDAEGTSDGGTEVAEVNALTKDIEFHGNTSSVAFLGRVRQQYGDQVDREKPPLTTESPSLVSAFHNHTFLPRITTVADDNESISTRFFFPHSYIFLDTYFNNLHYIHPIIEKETFLSRCEDLWQGRSHQQSRSFVALYFCLASLGALIRTWTEEKINGMGRFEWSRMLFEKAQNALGTPGFIHDLDAVQALFFMAKVCQNELNANLAYAYLGMAVRTSLATGINRNTSISGGPKSSDSNAISKTWWGLYSLEVETSFALGRPDSLGMDEYHNRPMQPITRSEIDILPCMISLSRLTRIICVKVYLNHSALQQKLSSAFQIETELNEWVSGLPDTIRPRVGSAIEGDTLLNDPAWARVQRLVLQIRYHNIKMLLLRPFILHAGRSASTDQRSAPDPALQEAIDKCTDSAMKTIEIIYETCRVHLFFRSWQVWYNITYLTFAVSIILFRAKQVPHADNSGVNYINLVEKTLGIFDAMKESVVACKTASILRQMLGQLGAPQEVPVTHRSERIWEQDQRSLHTASAPVFRPSPYTPVGDIAGAADYDLDAFDADLWDWGFDLKGVWDFRTALE
ncbi:hypothetical protein K490DRAFT_50891 [Saccharata proteae CBS 121410]|uniref:Zn(2)-C6 fungal-type domain-containing protein n=1 Tax=Saccharata proteae CBS 121410 TaxID=1314787 RepID=A0A9P4LU53_9PEZI|nr:hypothetical protein K490DRAFT_50891 [Saccharata proteae CBS 121410]